MLRRSAGSSRSLAVNVDISAFGDDLETDLKGAIRAMVSATAQPPQQTDNHHKGAGTYMSVPVSRDLPTRIRFPYARHSSLPELRHLVKAFRPNDIWPCTVDARDWYERGISMMWLFGEYCSGDKDVFEHDEMMDEVFQDFSDNDNEHIDEDESVQGQRSQPRPSSMPPNSSLPPQPPIIHDLTSISSTTSTQLAAQQQMSSQELGQQPNWRRPSKRSLSPEDPTSPSSSQRRRARHHPEPDGGDKTLQPSSDCETSNGAHSVRRSTSPLIRHTSRRARSNTAKAQQAAATLLPELRFSGGNVRHNSLQEDVRDEDSNDAESSQGHSQISIISISSDSSSTCTAQPAASPPLDARARAFRAAEEYILGDANWSGSRSGLGLISTTGNHSTLDVDLASPEHVRKEAS